MENTQKMLDDAKVYLKNNWNERLRAQENSRGVRACVQAAYLAGRRAQAEDDAGLLAAMKSASLYYLGEHAHDHPTSVKLRAAIAKHEGK